MTGTRPVGTTNTVRRMPSIRTSERSSYSACSMAALSDVAGTGPGGQVHRRGVGTVQRDDAVDCRGNRCLSAPRSRRQAMSGGQPGAPLGHADRPDVVSHAADPIKGNGSPGRRVVGNVGP